MEQSSSVWLVAANLVLTVIIPVIVKFISSFRKSKCSKGEFEIQRVMEEVNDKQVDKILECVQQLLNKSDSVKEVK